MSALPRWRLPAVLVVLGLLLMLLTWRLLSLQVLNTARGYEFLQGQGDARAIRTEVIPAHRGQIVDRNGEVRLVELDVGEQPAVLVERTDLTPQVVSSFVRQGVLLMAPFRKTEITDAELAALSAFVAGNYKKGG